MKLAVVSCPAIRELLVQKLQRKLQNMMRFTVNGHRMKRLRWKLHLVHLLLEREVFAE